MLTTGPDVVPALTAALATFDQWVLAGGDLAGDESYPCGLPTPSRTLVVLIEHLGFHG